MEIFVLDLCVSRSSKYYPCYLAIAAWLLLWATEGLLDFNNSSKCIIFLSFLFDDFSLRSIFLYSFDSLTLNYIKQQECKKYFVLGDRLLTLMMLGIKMYSRMELRVKTRISISFPGCDQEDMTESSSCKRILCKNKAGWRLSIYDRQLNFFKKVFRQVVDKLEEIIIYYKIMNHNKYLMKNINIF